MDELSYKECLEKQTARNESLCKRCGECCGASNDPCANLIKEESGRYACRVYDNRLGPQKTVSGRGFTCVPIRDNIARGFRIPGCAYVK
ncbi:MAG: hypothetical protein WC592_07700 [Candidatus Omnitrophota bacterium]